MPATPAEILQRVKRIEIKTRNLVEEVFTGEYHAMFKGQGLEFSEVREYQIGDSYRDIDWNVSARFGHPYIKKFRETRELNVLFLIDLSASNQFGTKGQIKSDFIAELTAVLSFSALSNQDKVGLLLFTDRIEKYLPPRKGRKYTLQILRDILYPDLQGKGTDLAGALSFAARLLKKRSIVFLISDFLAHDYTKPLQLLANKHDVIALQVIDPAERILPASGLVRIYNPETGDSDVIDLSDKSLRKQYEQYIKVEQEQLSKKMAQAHVDLLPLQTDQSYVQELQKFFDRRIKRRR
ncbi:MAG TPA: DUF58 domain-containing protein [Candidatus Cloacimonadota bacterium]|nr:DUF58 domain-containing protein [Candidatus Cloacimonadota bacterium]HOV16116.1 DUF58 domain-containing protein [Candidatus Cloacimonadota bacterium]HQL14788.1 DUF58 domain-containing protein [Candidatus Cloacimonadota bacterium]